MGALPRLDFASEPERDRVRCLDCGWVYVKPEGRGTALVNPACPRCGYVGWLDAAVPVTPAMLRNRSAPALRRARPLPRH